MTELEFANAVDKEGGVLYLVGGAIRDIIAKQKPKDKDYVITGLKEDSILFKDCLRTGESFPVFRLNINGDNREVALARTERKNGTGYTGFEYSSSPEITIEEDLYRRDLTMNSIAMNILTKEIIDPYNGIDDIINKLIKHTSHHFKEDPIRALRAARLAAKLDFVIDDTTIEMMESCKEELQLEPSERFFNELSRVLTTDKPSVFFRHLQQANLLDISYPPIYDLIGKTHSPEHHPEGDAFEHTMDCVDMAVTLTDRPEVVFAVLMHDIGKGKTPMEDLPRHIAHELRGMKIIKEMDCTIPTLWKSCAKFAAMEHMRIPRLVNSKKIVESIMSIHKSNIGFDGIATVLKCDKGDLPVYLKHYDFLLKKFLEVKGTDAPSNLKGSGIGWWIKKQRVGIYDKFKKEIDQTCL